MHQVDFVRINIQNTLKAEGFHAEVVYLASSFGVSRYKSGSNFPKGQVFERCLKHARKFATTYQKHKRFQNLNHWEGGSKKTCNCPDCGTSLIQIQGY